MKERGLKEERVELNNGIGRQIVPPFSSLNAVAASASSPSSYFDPELKREHARPNRLLVRNAFGAGSEPIPNS